MGRDVSSSPPTLVVFVSLWAVFPGVTSSKSALDLMMHAMTLVMRFNVFESGDTFHRQTSVTAMGGPNAVT